MLTGLRSANAVKRSRTLIMAAWLAVGASCTLRDVATGYREGSAFPSLCGRRWRVRWSAGAIRFEAEWLQYLCRRPQRAGALQSLREHHDAKVTGVIACVDRGSQRSGQTVGLRCLDSGDGRNKRWRSGLYGLAV
eukprot:6203771-Pleurochrysis_carterae.AAC.2